MSVEKIRIRKGDDLHYRLWQAKSFIGRSSPNCDSKKRNQSAWTPRRFFCIKKRPSGRFSNLCLYCL